MLQSQQCSECKSVVSDSVSAADDVEFMELNEMLLVFDKAPQQCSCKTEGRFIKQSSNSLFYHFASFLQGFF